MKVPDLEELVSASERVYAATQDTTTLRNLPAVLWGQTARSLSGSQLMHLCKLATPPSDKRAEQASLLFGYIVLEYIELHGDPVDVPYIQNEFGEQPGDTYFDTGAIKEIVDSLIGER